MKSKSTKKAWLHLSYWSAAIADFYIGIAALFPEKMGVDDFKYPMGLFSAVAISWGIMLLLADRKPIERRWVILPTIIVVSLLTITRIVSVEQGLITFSPLLLGLSIIILFILTYTFFITRNN